jgi:tetratricopeptide (TPR) repeat protein
MSDKRRAIPEWQTVEPWLERVSRHLSESDSPCAVIASRASGIDTIVASLGTRTSPLLWVKFDELDAEDEVGQGSRLAEAIARSIGSPLVGSGLPLRYVLEVLLRFHDLVGPFTVVLSNAHLAPGAAKEFLLLDKTASRLVVVSDSESILGHVPVKALVREDVLLLSREEGREMAESIGGGGGSADIDEILTGSSFRMNTFQAEYRRRRGLPPLLVPEPGGASVEGHDNQVLDPLRTVEALLARGAAPEAFELAVRSGLPLRDELVAKAAQHFFDRGLHKRVFNLLDGLGQSERQRSDELMKWYFSAATATNRHLEVKVEVQRFLAQHEAPELRALCAGAFPGPDMVVQTARALAASSTPITLRMHAFALTQTRLTEEGLECLLKALQLSEALGLDDMVMACATDLADYWGKRGNYLDSLEWARWALDWHVAHSLRDEVRRLVALSVSCFIRMLTGDTLGLQSAVDELDLSLAGIPTMESTVSTRGDWLFLSGNVHEAVQMYRMNLASVSLGQFHYAAVDLVHALNHVGELKDAQEIGSRARILTMTSDPVNRAIGNLAFGLAAAASDEECGIHILTDVQSVLGHVVEAPRLAQASIALAKLHLRQGREDAAREALVAGEPALRELGFTGWTLLGGFDPEVKLLYQLFHGKSDELELHFLGAERIVYRGRPIELGLRQCECLVVMASRPQGVTAERLGMEVYGEASVHSTLKAIVSRLRQVVPIENRPYRVGVSMWSDFVELERLLAAGRVREAMSLYRGPLLPRSDAPAVVELRDHLDESIRRAVLRAGDVEALLQLAKLSESDLELFEVALERLSPNDPRFPIVRARLEQVRRNWQQA